VARWAAFITRHENPDASWLTVDAGNFVDRAGGTGGCTNKCQFMIYSYKDLHYDVLNIGRQEVWMGKETLKSIIDTTKTEFVSANLLDLHSGKPFAKPYVIKDYGNLRVGILGLLNEADFPAGSSMIDTTAFKIGSYMDAVKKYVPLLNRKADLVVLLCELPSTALDTMLVQYPDVDLVISSGAIKTGEQPTKIGRTQIVGTGSSGYSGHYCLLELNPAWKDSVGFTNFTDFLTDTYEEKGAWADRLTAFNTNPPPNPPVPAAKPSTSVTPLPQGTAKPSTSPTSSPTPSATPPATIPNQTPVKQG
jgi:2',3'-cyclic-nucleotide 2'-phosphodiesterase (5'-nucleotidase family)